MLYSAFLLGFLGSFHCVGMCGPIALSLPLSPKSNFARWLGHFTYQFGKISAYVLLGILIGTLGKGISLLGFQKSYNLLLGVLLLLIGIGSLTGKYNILSYLEQRMVFFKGKMGKFIQRFSYTSLYSIGFLNGLLPCGLVYIAILGASSFGTFSDSVLYMFFFGLGVMPSLVALSVFGHVASFSWRNKLRKIYPLTSVVLGVFLIIRSIYIDRHLPYSPFDNVHHEIPMCSGRVQ
ncbi:MAG: sulfite exporter TauE/SafE family protein [Saprospiraceae bacterium]